MIARLVAAFTRLRALLLSPDVRAERNPAHDAILVEGFIPGREYAVEGVLHHGALDVLAIFDKPDPLDGPFFEETIYVTPSPLPNRGSRRLRPRCRARPRPRPAARSGSRRVPRSFRRRLRPRSRRASDRRPVRPCAAVSIGIRDSGFGIRTTSRDQRIPTSDLRIPNPESRITLEELLLRQATGESPAVWARESDASGVMMIPIPRRGMFRRVDGIDEARAVAGVDDVRITAKADQLLVPLPEGASYLGFIFARAERPGDVEAALRAAHARLDVRPSIRKYRVLQSRTWLIRCDPAPPSPPVGNKSGRTVFCVEVSEGTARPRQGAVAR